MRSTSCQPSPGTGRRPSWYPHLTTASTSSSSHRPGACERRSGIGEPHLRYGSERVGGGQRQCRRPAVRRRRLVVDHDCARGRLVVDDDRDRARGDVPSQRRGRLHRACAGRRRTPDVFQVREYGADESLVPTFVVPSSRNWTPATPTSSVAVAVRATAVPRTWAPSAGAVIVTFGAPRSAAAAGGAVMVGATTSAVVRSAVNEMGRDRACTVQSPVRRSCDVSRPGERPQSGPLRLDRPQGCIVGRLLVLSGVFVNTGNRRLHPARRRPNQRPGRPSHNAHYSPPRMSHFAARRATTSIRSSAKRAALPG